MAGGRQIVCIAPRGRLARADEAALAARLPGVALSVRSIAGYCASPTPESRILICPSGASASRDLDFLRRAADRLLWPAAPADFRDAIAGLRTTTSRPRPARFRRARARAGDTVSALLLEGRVDPARMRSILAAASPRSVPRDWIVESPCHVALSARWARTLARAGVRLSALEPVELVAVYAAPALARMSARWRRLLPPRTPVWVKEF
ncbi:MAG TPA: hypothetical protein VGH97_05010 [Thermoanaerobaculia bacterium]|jgi:hypothetical protein